jgi:hypothetical protein
MTDLIGLPIKLERTIDGPCAVCGETAVIIGPGTGPHVAALRCICCDRHRGWLPKAVADFLMATIAQFGLPAEAITIRTSEFAQANGAAPLGAPAAPQYPHPESETKDH